MPRSLALAALLATLMTANSAWAGPNLEVGLDPALGIGFDVDSHVGPGVRLRGGLSFGDALRLGPELMLQAVHLIENVPISASAGVRLGWGRSVSGSVSAHLGVGYTGHHGVQMYWDAGASLDFELSERWSLGAALRLSGLWWADSKSAMWMELGPALSFRW